MNKVFRKTETSPWEISTVPGEAQASPFALY
jgi:hypothetical protein